MMVRAWNVLILSALQSTSSGPASALLQNLGKFSAPYSMSLRMHVISTSLPIDITAADVNHAYVAIKLWLLLTQKSSRGNAEKEQGPVITGTAQSPRNEDEYAWLVWNELWPAFERLISLCESDGGKKVASVSSQILLSQRPASTY